VNPQDFVDLMIGNMLRCVGVPMVSEFGVDIPQWNVKVSHYVGFFSFLQVSSSPKVVPSSFSTWMTYEFLNKLENS
jgi:hypothetical protein